MSARASSRGGEGLYCLSPPCLVLSCRKDTCRKPVHIVELHSPSLSPPLPPLVVGTGRARTGRGCAPTSPPNPRTLFQPTRIPLHPSSPFAFVSGLAMLYSPCVLFFLDETKHTHLPKLSLPLPHSPITTTTTTVRRVQCRHQDSVAVPRAFSASRHSKTKRRGRGLGGCSS